MYWSYDVLGLSYVYFGNWYERYIFTSYVVGTVQKVNDWLCSKTVQNVIFTLGSRKCKNFLTLSFLRHRKFPFLITLKYVCNSTPKPLSKCVQIHVRRGSRQREALLDVPKIISYHREEKCRLHRILLNTYNR